MGSELTPKFDQEALQRILQRAAELQADERDVSGSLDGNEVLALGAMSASPSATCGRRCSRWGRCARRRSPKAGWTRWSGPRPCTLSGWFAVIRRPSRRRWCATSKRKKSSASFASTEGQVMLEPVGGWQAAVKRATGSKKFMLKKAERISVTIVPLEPGLCQVVLRATLRDLRRGYIGGAAALLSTAVAATVVLGALNAFWPVLLMPLPGAFGFSWAIGKAYRSEAERTQLGLECALDHAERGAVRASHQLPGRKTMLDTVISEIETLVANRTPRSGNTPRSKP